jgi:zinc transport system permease protein
MSPVYEFIREIARSGAQGGWLPGSFEYGFVVNALICTLFIGPVLGGVGTMVVTKRLAFFCGAIGHAALTGVAIGILLGEPYTAPYVSMFAFCMIFGLVMNFTKNRTRVPSDTIIGVFLSLSLAIGACLLLYVTAKINVHILDSLLFGSILTVNDRDMNVLVVMTIGCLLLGLPFFNHMLLASFNPSLAEVRGVRVRVVDYLFVVMVTILTVASVKIIGAILVEALLLIPAAAARNLSRSIRGFILLSMLFATLSCGVGVVLPMELELPVPSGGAIILVAAAIFFVTAVIRLSTRKYREANL